MEFKSKNFEEIKKKIIKKMMMMNLKNLQIN